MTDCLFLIAKHTLTVYYLFLGSGSHRCSSRTLSSQGFSHGDLHCFWLQCQNQIPGIPWKWNSAEKFIFEILNFAIYRQRQIPKCVLKKQVDNQLNMETCLKISTIIILTLTTIIGLLSQKSWWYWYQNLALLRSFDLHDINSIDTPKQLLCPGLHQFKDVWCIQWLCSPGIDHFRITTFRG